MDNTENCVDENVNYFTDVPNENLGVPFKEITMQYLDVDIKDFIDNDIILLRSGTGTGKTRAIAKIAKELCKNTDSTFLSIVNLIALSREQINTFKEFKMELTSYQNGIEGLVSMNGVICVNSLFKLMTATNFVKMDFKNTILYIDEVDDLIKGLTHNDSMDSVLNLTYMSLLRVIKECKKIILSDATINQNVLNLLSCRKEHNKTLLINNLNKKFEKVKAIRHHNENDFIEELRNHIENKKYFLFGCDSCKMVSKLYTTMMNEFEDQKGSFILITSETNFNLFDAKIQFKDKYVFYSPKITTGVSFYIEDEKQTQFIYITQVSRDPIGIYQMSSRTRNMDKLIYYSNEKKPRELKFKTLEELKEFYKNIITTNNKILSMSKSVTEDDDIKIVENSFFKLYCYNEYISNIYDTGFIEHYEKILKSCGFILESTGEDMTISKQEKRNMTDLRKIIEEMKFDEYVNYYEEHKDDGLLELDMDDYKFLDDRRKLLNLSEVKDIKEFNIFLRDEYKLRDYYGVMSLFKTNEYITKKLNNLQKDSFDVKNIDSKYNKINIIRKFEEHYKIQRFDFTFENIDITVEPSNELKSVITHLFRTKKNKYDTKKELVKIYIQLIRNICCDMPLIKSERGRILKTKNREQVYSIDVKLMSELFKLVPFKNKSFKNYNIDLIKKYITIEIVKPLNDGNVDDDDYANYAFGKTLNKK